MREGSHAEMDRGSAGRLWVTTRRPCGDFETALGAYERVDRVFTSRHLPVYLTTASWEAHAASDKGYLPARP